MQKKIWIRIALVLVIPAMLFTTACAKKSVQSDISEAPVTQEEEAVQEDVKAEEAADQVQEESLASDEQTTESEDEAKTEVSDAMAKMDVFYAFDSSALSGVAQKALDAKAQWLLNNPEIKLVIEGHCDERGTTEYNLALGEKRALRAKTYLIDMGVEESRLQAISYGEERPFVKESNERAWAQNRRAHFVQK